MVSKAYVTADLIKSKRRFTLEKQRCFRFLPMDKASSVIAARTKVGLNVTRFDVGISGMLWVLIDEKFL